MTQHDLTAALRNAANLDDLLEQLQALTDEQAGEVEATLTDLPTYGGAEPRDTYGIYSWDEGRLLVAEDGEWMIVEREPKRPATRIEIVTDRESLGSSNAPASTTEVERFNEILREQIAGLYPDAEIVFLTQGLRSVSVFADEFEDDTADTCRQILEDAVEGKFGEWQDQAEGDAQDDDTDTCPATFCADCAEWVRWSNAIQTGRPGESNHVIGDCNCDAGSWRCLENGGEWDRVERLVDGEWELVED